MSLIKGPGEDQIKAGCGLTGMMIVIPLLILLVIMLFAAVGNLFS